MFGALAQFNFRMCVRIVKLDLGGKTLPACCPQAVGDEKLVWVARY